jgi:hypothetical protein
MGFLKWLWRNASIIAATLNIGMSGILLLIANFYNDLIEDMTAVSLCMVFFLLVGMIFFFDSIYDKHFRVLSKRIKSLEDTARKEEERL